MFALQLNVLDVVVILTVMVVGALALRRKSQ